MTLHRNAGVNLAAVEAILHLRERVDMLPDQLRSINEALPDRPELENGSEAEYGPESS